ncbi:hypothetical protein GCM10010435_52740 [Winogradskya consettensis]|uniref:N-acetyltransferase domain-containing protein n=1 Tax=Winogradskya consettensis TaxID=113560 RepID=A0A919SG06_9ACTN|nr:GNAT family N-acetyltransferase [Actinoplanes consettensis]GIM71722.1 hypothetical protein Aco04nite_26700 [Actinoplanes consettensis]
MERAKQLWQELARVPVTFGGSGVEVVVSPTSALCPPGWAGIVSLGEAAIATTPDEDSARIVRQALDGLPATATTDPSVLPVLDTLGPATLAYCGPASFRPAVDGGVESIPADLLGALLAGVPADDDAEAGLEDITSPAFVLHAGNDIVAAAGYRLWPCETAHLSVLTAPEHRRRGLARLVASAAVSHALDAGLLPQWRARPEPSRRVARALGFQEWGSQLSVRLTNSGRS